MRCFRAAYRPLVSKSVDHGQCRLRPAAAVLCTTGNRRTVRRRHSTRCSMQIFHASRKNYVLGHFYMIFNALLLLLCSEGQFALWCQIYLSIKMHGNSHVLPIHGKLYHTLSSARYLCVCNGLTPFYGYASRTFFTRKKGLGMLHVIFHGNSATYHC